MAVKALPRGSPSSRISQPSGGCGFWVAITVGLGGRGTLSVISHRNVICVFTAQRSLSQAYTLNPALQTSVGYSVPLAKEEWECVDVGIRLCLSARMKVWVAGRGVEDLYSERCSCSVWLAALMAVGLNSCECRDTPAWGQRGGKLNKSRWPPLPLLVDHTEQHYHSHYTDKHRCPPTHIPGFPYVSIGKYLLLYVQ